MKYQDFKKQLPPLSLPMWHTDLLERQDGIHFVLRFGTIEDEKYNVFEELREYDEFLGAIRIIESRGAVREKDFIVCCRYSKTELQVLLHTTNKYLSDEDISLTIKRIDTRELGK